MVRQLKCSHVHCYSHKLLLLLLLLLLVIVPVAMCCIISVIILVMSHVIELGARATTFRFNVVAWLLIHCRVANKDLGYLRFCNDERVYCLMVLWLYCWFWVCWIARPTKGHIAWLTFNKHYQWRKHVDDLKLGRECALAERTQSRMQRISTNLIELHKIRYYHTTIVINYHYLSIVSFWVYYTLILL